MNVRHALLLFCVSLAAIGCEAEEPAEWSSCDEAEEHADLAWIQDNIFTPNCASFDACHQGGDLAAAGLSLEAGDSEMNLVGVAAARSASESLVVPGNPDESYLMVVLGDDDVGPTAATMPPNSPLLCAEKRHAIRRWIDALDTN